MHAITTLRRIVTVASATVAMAFGLGVPLSPPAFAGTPSLFATLNRPIGLAATTSKVLVTRFCADKIYQVSDAGAVSQFATLPSTGGSCIERYFAAAPGTGGFQAGWIYGVQGQTVYEIPPAGGTATTFTTVSGLPPGETGITFDTVGTFGFHMLLTDRRGPVYEVTSTGSVTQIADVGAQIEGPVVAPLAFAPFGGDLLMGNEFADRVYAVEADGTVTIAFNYESPEAAIFIPSPVCNFGSSGGAYFQANENNNQITKFPASDFTGRSGAALLPSELGTTIGLARSTGTTIRISTFQRALGGALEGGAFHPCG